MNPTLCLGLFTFVVLVNAVGPLAALSQVVPSVPHSFAPPEPPPLIERPPVELVRDPVAPPLISAAAQPPYSIGEPTDEEQLYLEYVNRARANPPAEGLRLAFSDDAQVRSAIDFFTVNTNALVLAFNAIVPAPPIAFNERLIAAARGHSRDMFTNAFQGHVGSDGRDLGRRLNAAGYAYSTFAENVFSYAEGVWHGHAGFEIDWGFGPDGMQSPPGHRNAIHNAGFREVGIGIVNGMNSIGTNTIGPQLVTQDFGTGFDSRPFVTGVVYYDINGNNFYDRGEGVRGVRVEVSGIAQAGISAGSGGYALLANNGTRTVTFSGNNLLATARSLTITGNANAKADLVLAYVPPTIAGPASISVGSTNQYAFTPLPGATSHEVSSQRLLPYMFVDGAEGGATNMIVDSAPGYSVVATDVLATGANSFHLAMPNFNNQSLTINRVLRPGGNGALVYASRLAYATITQIARTQVSTNDGTTWADVWIRMGTGNSGQAGFGRVTNSLAAFAGREIRVRFLYEFTGGSAYTQTTAGFGWYIDDIAFVNTEEAASPVTQSILAGTNFVFAPTQQGAYALRARARLGNAYAPWGPSFNVAVGPAAVVLRITQIATPVVGQVRIDFDVLSGAVGTLTLECRNSFDQSWFTDSGTTLTTITPGVRYRFTTTSSGSSQRFFRVKNQ